MNSQRLSDFLSLLPDDLARAVELRDPSWHSESIYRLLRTQAMAFCQYDSAGFESPPVVTADLVYPRLHGPEAACAGSYPETALRAWVDRLMAWMA